MTDTEKLKKAIRTIQELSDTHFVMANVNGGSQFFLKANGNQHLLRKALVQAMDTPQVYEVFREAVNEKTKELLHERGFALTGSILLSE